MSDKPYDLLPGNNLEVLRDLPSDSVHAAVTSPPYWPNQRDYGGVPTLWPISNWTGCLGDEPTPLLFVQNLRLIFAELKRVLRPDGVLWVNLGDSVAQDNKLIAWGIKRGDLLGIPWMFAFEMRDKGGWYLRSDDIWHKPDAMPRSTPDTTSRAHEYIFQFTKTREYYFDREAIRIKDGEQEHYHRSVWKIAASNYKGGHFATFPEKLAATAIKASTSEHGVCDVCGMPYRRIVKRTRIPTRPAKENKVDTTKKACRDPLRHITKVETLGWERSCDSSSCYGAGVIPATVMDPFNGAGTTGVAAIRNNRRYIGIELVSNYVDLTAKRLDSLNVVTRDQVK